MIRIVVAGQVEKQKIAELVNQLGTGKVQVDIKGDMDGALAMKAAQYDYYLGACNTGGGAIAMAIAIVGRDKCATVSTPGKKPRREEILQEISNGKKVFGFVSDHIEDAVSFIMEGILSSGLEERSV